MNIYLITDEEVFAIAHDLSTSLAKRLCKQYNNQFSSHKKYVKTSTFPLDCIVGYVYIDKHTEGGESCLTYEQAVKLLVKQIC